MFWRKNWHWLLTFIVVCGIGGFILLRSKPPTNENKVFKVPELSQVRKKVSDKGDKIPMKQSTKENIGIQVEKPRDPVDATPKSMVDTVSLGNAEEGILSEETSEFDAKTDDWRTNDYGESYYGFGKYPKIPSDFPREYRPGWTRTNASIQREEIQDLLRAQELADRVRIKLWNQGRTDVTTIDISPITYNFYPLTANTIVVKYTGTGETKQVGSIFTDVNFPLDLVARIEAGEKPPGIKILDFDSDGINVFEFLGL